MTASVSPIRFRKPNRRPGALPAQAPYPFTTADRLPAWLALLEEESARRGLPSEVAAAMTATELTRLAQTPGPF
jgi:hypothetical protein